METKYLVLVAQNSQLLWSNRSLFNKSELIMYAKKKEKRKKKKIT